MVALVVVAVGCLVTAITLVVANRDEKGVGAPATSTTVATSTTTPTSTTTTTTTPATNTPAPNRPSAIVALNPFLSAAATLDDQLHDAAAAINATGPPWSMVTREVASTVKAADLARVVRAIPAGLPPDLLRSVIVVYSDLASRRYAMADFSVPYTIEPNTYPNSEDILHHLGNGHAAATRFTADLDATRALAKASPAVTVLPPTSRQAAEVWIYTQYINGANGGCDGRGGKLFTEPPPIVWTGPGEGKVGGIAFTADLDENATWQVSLNAC